MMRAIFRGDLLPGAITSAQAQTIPRVGDQKGNPVAIGKAPAFRGAHLAGNVFQNTRTGSTAFCGPACFWTIACIA
jgi:hypothetical protein